jgi:alanine-synthesizing transaminase
MTSAASATAPRAIGPSRRLDGVSYDVRGSAAERASALEAAGLPVLRLNIGDPAAFGFDAVPELLDAVADQLRTAVTYSESQGLEAAREAVANRFREAGCGGVTADDVFLGNGVSEAIQLAVHALVDDGDEVLVPSPGYPLWPATVRLCGGVPVSYACVEDAGWEPDLDDVAGKVTGRTRALVVVNPNNPTGAVYAPETVADLAGLARRHSLVLFADEIYDRVVYDGATHTPAALAEPDAVRVTFGGLSKSHAVPGLRAGWLVLSGARDRARGYIEGLRLVASLRLCPNVAGQLAVPVALALGGLLEDPASRARLQEQRDRAWTLMSSLPGVSCVRPKGAFYAFPRIVPRAAPVRDDRRFALELLLEEHLLVVPGTAFGWPQADHFRIVTLPRTGELDDAAARLERFLRRSAP